MAWPKQSQCDAFYGNPRGSGEHSNPAWEAANLVWVTTPWNLFYAGKPIKGNRFRIHKKCAPALTRIFQRIWESAHHSQATIDKWGMSDFSGSFNYRPKRGGATLSMHAYGCAVDFDADRNSFGGRSNFRTEPEVLAAFASEGAVWGGTWSKPDGMHWQFAIVR